MAPNATRNPVLRNAIARILALSLAAAAQQALPANTPCTTSPDQTTVTCTTDQRDGVTLVSGTLRRLEIRGLAYPIGPVARAGITFATNQGNDAVVVVGSPQDASVVVRTTGAQHAGISAASSGVTPPPPASARDPFLGLFMPGDPGVPDGRADVTSHADVQTTGDQSPGLSASSSSSGYSTVVTNQTFSASGFAFAITSVRQPGGGTVAAGSTVAGVLVDARGEVLRDANGNPRTAGTFTVADDLSFNFTRGTAFDSLAVGETAYVALDYVVHGTSPVAGSTPLDLEARLLVTVQRADAKTLDESRVAYFSRFGIRAWPEPAAGAAWVPQLLPDLQGYVDEQLLNARSGARGGTAAVTNEGSVRTTGVASHGIVAETRGANGAPGRDGSLFRSAREGASGQDGGDAIATANGTIVTEGRQSAGVLASSIGGVGGSGGNGGTFRWGQAGGTGGDGGDVYVQGDGTIGTQGDWASGIFAVSHGGLGGAGGTGAFVTPGGNGGIGGQGGAVTVSGNWNITTGTETTGQYAYGIWAKSVGGDAGSGGSGGWLAGAPGNGGQATDGDVVQVTSGGTILTRGDYAAGIHAQSIGGFGGSGGGGFSLFYSRGGSGASAGSGGAVTVTQTASGRITTRGLEAHGILAESIGGGGGSGGDTSGFIARGGSPGHGGNGDDVTVTNAGYVATSGAGAYGILAQSIGGGGGDGGSAKGAGALGGEGNAGGTGGTVTLTNAASGEVYALGAHAVGLFAQSVGGGGGNGGSSSGIVPIGGRGSETSNGGDVTVTNAGLVYSNSYGLFAQSIGGGGGNGGQATGWFSFGGDGGGGGKGLGVTVGNRGEIYTRESDASAIFAQSVGGGGGSGGSSVAVGGMVAVAIGGDGAKGGDGGNVDVDSDGGYLWTQGDRSRGIQAQSVGGGGGSGGYAFAGSAGPGFSISAAFGGSGAAGGAGGEVVLNSRTDVGTQGDDSHGLFAQSVGGGGGSGGFGIALSGSDVVGIAASFGGTGGAGGKAATVDMGASDDRLAGYIVTAGRHSYGVLAQSVGGGGGDGGFSVAGAVGGAVGASLSFGGSAGVGGSGDDVDVYSNTTVDTLGNDSHGIFAQSVGGGGGSGGFSVAAVAAGSLSVGASFGGAGGGGALAGDVVLDSTGTYVHTAGDHAYGLVAQSVGGSGGDGGFSVAGGLSGGFAVNFAMGGSGGAGGHAGDVTLRSTTRVGTGGDASYGLFAQSVGGGGGSGGFTVGAGISGSAGVNVGLGGEGGAGALAGDVTLDSAGSVGTQGDDAHAIFAQSVGGGGGAGGFSVAAGVAASAQIGVSLGGDGAAGGNAGDVAVANRGDKVVTAGDRAHGVLAQSIGGSGGNAGFSVAGGLSSSVGVNFAMGGDGGAAGLAGAVTLDSFGSVVTAGDDAYALFAQSVGGGGGAGGFSVGAGISSSPQIGVSLGGDGGSGGNAGTVRLDSNGARIATEGARAYGVLAQSIGGSGGSGGFSVAGGISKSASINFAMGGDGGEGSTGNSVDLTNASIVTTAGEGAHGLFAQSVGGGGGSGGFSVTGGVSASSAQIGASIGGEGGSGSQGGSVTLRTHGAVIETLGDRAYGVLAQSVGGTGGDGGFAVAGGLSLRGSLPAINFALGGGGGDGSLGGAVRLDSSSAVHTRGDAAHGVLAQSVGGGGGSGGFAVAGGIAAKGAQVSVGLGGTGGAGSSASGVWLTSTGTQVFTEGERAFGLFAQSVGGGGGDGGFAAAGGTGDQASIEFAMGGSGSAGGAGADVRLDSSSAVTTLGGSAHGIVAQSVGGGGGAGGFALTGSLARGAQSRTVNVGIGGQGGGGGGAGDVDVTQRGTLETFGTRAYGVLAQSVGGGGGDGGLAKVVNLLEEFEAPEIPDALLDEQDKGKPKSLSFGISVGAGGAGGDAGLGGNVAVDNAGAVTTHGSGSHALFAQSVGGSGGTGGLSAVDGTGGNGDISIDINVGVGGTGGGGGTAGTVDVVSTGALTTLGAGAHGIVAQSVGGGGGSGGASATTTKGANPDAKVGVSINASIGGSGGVAGDGNRVNVTNDGAIDTSGANAYGVFAQSVGGGGGDGGNSAVAMGDADEEEDEDDAGEEGGDAGGDDEAKPETWSVGIGIGVGGGGGGSGIGGAVGVDSRGTIVTRGAGSHGIFAQSVGGSGGVGGVAATTTSVGGADVGIQLSFGLGGSGGGGGSGGAVDVDNDGSVLTFGTGAHGIFAQSVGGGGGAGGSSLANSRTDASDDQISVDLDVAIGGAGAVAGHGGLVTVDNAGRIETQGDGAYAVLAQSVGGGGGHGGLSIATPGGGEQSSFALGVAVGGGGAAGGQGGKVAVSSLGDMLTFGDDAIAVFAQSVGGGGGAGGSSVAASGGAKWAAIDVAIGGSAGGGNTGGEVKVINAGDIDTAGSAAHGIYAQSVGGGGGRGGNAQTVQADEDTGAGGDDASGEDDGSGDDDGGDGFKFGLSLGGSGGGASSGGLVTVTQDGTIRTRGTGAHGVFAQSVGGGGGEGGYGGFAGKDRDDAGWSLPNLELQIALGGSGGSAAAGGNVSFNGEGDIVTFGDAAAGVMLQSVGGGGGVGGFGLAAATGSVAFGGAGTSGGNGGNVNASIDGSIVTFGRAAFGLLAQSVGGGGGAAGDVTAGIDPLEGFGLGLAFGRSGGTGGDGGAVRVTTTGDIYTAGDGAIGLFAQSVGGGGGLGGTAVGTLPFAGSVGGVGAGGLVAVTHTGDIVTLGAGAHGIVGQSAGGTGTGAAVDIVVDGNVVVAGRDASGIVAQSRGNAGGSNLRVELQREGAIFGGTGAGAAVTFLDGADNLLLNQGFVGSVDGLSGLAVVGRAGAETVRNHGTIAGRVDLGAGRNAFFNETGALLETGATVVLGAGNVLHNAGALSPGGLGTFMTTALSGDYFATPQAQHWFDVDLGGGGADQLLVSGAVTLDGTLHVQFTGLPTATAQRYALVSGEGALSDLGLELGESSVLPAAFVIALDSGDGSTWLDLRPDFSGVGAGLSGNAGAFGAHLDAIVDAGPGTGMQALLDTVASMPSATDLEKAFAQLQPTPYAALPAGATIAQLRFNETLLSCRPMTGEHRFSGETECAWARAAAWQFTRDADDTSDGFKQESLEASLGVQKAVGDGSRWFAGMGLSFEDTQTDARPYTHSDGQLLQLGGVVKGLFGPFSTALSFGAGRGSYDTTRQVPVAGEGVQARSEQDLTLYSSNLRLAYDFTGPAWYVRPLLDVDYAHLRVDAFREHGAGVANLRVDESSEDFVALRPALEAGAEFDSTRGMLLRPFVRLGTTQVVEGDSQVLSARLEGDAAGVAPFTVRTEGEDSYFDAALGFDVLRSSGPSLRFTYGGQFASGSELFAVSLKFWVPVR